MIPSDLRRATRRSGMESAPAAIPHGPGPPPRRRQSGDVKADGSTSDPRKTGGVPFDLEQTKPLLTTTPGRGKRLDFDRPVEPGVQDRDLAALSKRPGSGSGPRRRAGPDRRRSAPVRLPPIRRWRTHPAERGADSIAVFAGVRGACRIRGRSPGAHRCSCGGGPSRPPAIESGTNSMSRNWTLPVDFVDDGPDLLDGWPAGSLSSQSR